MKPENVVSGSYKIGNLLDFINKLYKMVAFNYVPHQWKQYFFYSSNDFESLKKSNVQYSVYSSDVQKFRDKLNREGIIASEEKNCFRLYHLEGVHAYYTFGKDLTTVADTTYTVYDEAAGNCTLLKEYINKLKDLGIYDNSTVVIMADHGNVGYSQNPIFLIKNRGEVHDFNISDAAMSFEYLPEIWTALINENQVDEIFINKCRREGEDRRFLYYMWDNVWDRDYLPTISEMFANGIASDIKNMIFSGIQYESVMKDYSYTLGTELSFTDETTIKTYCTSGFSGTEESKTWTNGKQSTMIFDIKGEKYDNLLFTLESGILGSQQEVLIYANDHQVADVKFYDLERKQIIIPNEYVKDGLVKITMKYPDATTPHDIDENSGDRRLLALSVRSIKLESTDNHFDINDQITDAYQLETLLIFSNTNNTAKNYCISGFSEAEEAFTWTDSNLADMSFFILNEEWNNLILEYTCVPFNGKQHIILYANDQKVADYDLTMEETKEVSIPAECIQNGKLNLHFELPDAKSPKELGMSEDARTLGLAMKELTIKSIE